MVHHGGPLGIISTHELQHFIRFMSPSAMPRLNAGNQAIGFDYAAEATSRLFSKQALKTNQLIIAYATVGVLICECCNNIQLTEIPVSCKHVLLAVIISKEQ